MSTFAIQPLQSLTNPNGNLPSPIPVITAHRCLDDEWCDEDDDIWLLGAFEEPRPLIVTLAEDRIESLQHAR